MVITSDKAEKMNLVAAKGLMRPWRVISMYTCSHGRGCGSEIVPEASDRERTWSGKGNRAERLCRGE